MELSFFLNQMGVYGLYWYEDNKIPYSIETRWSNILDKEISSRVYEKYYCCGRIDVSNHPEHPFNFEYGVDIMDGDSWNKLGEWLSHLTLDYLPDTVEEIYEMFEQQTNFKINWWTGGKK